MVSNVSAQSDTLVLTTLYLQMLWDPFVYCNDRVCLGFSSPEREVLMMSYCDRSPPVVVGGGIVRPW